MIYLRFSLTRIRVLVGVILVLSLPNLIVARLVKVWTYQEMFDKASLVVIAYAMSSKDTAERTMLLNDVRVVGVTTDFGTFLVLKGGKGTRKFQLHHYRLEFSSDETNIANGPDLVRIEPGHSVFLLFLIKEQDGRYAPVTGQSDAALFSVLRLNSAAGNFEPSVH